MAVPPSTSTHVGATARAAATDGDHWSVLLEQLPVGVIVLGPDGAAIDANPAAERLLGVTLDEQRARTLRSEEWSVVRPDGSTMPVEEYPAARVLAGEQRVDGVELGVRRPAATTAWLRVSAVAAPTVAGRGALVVVEDVSHLRAAEARGDRAQEVLALACDAADLALWRFPGTDGRAEVLEGGAALRRTGLVDGDRYLLAPSLHRAADRASRRAMEQAAEAARAGEPYEVIFRVAGPTGETVWFLERGQPSPSGGGAMLGATLDITEQAVSQELLESTERRVATVVEAAPDIISVVAPTGELRYVSPVVERVLGVTAAELVGHHHEGLVDPAVLADPSTHATAEPSSHRTAVLDADEREVWLESTTRPVIDPGSGDVIEFVSVTRDVTRQVRAYEELERLHAAAEEGTRTKSRFLANMSHEIRTPMNAILGMAHLALNGPLSEQQRRRVENIEQSADSLLSIINDILDHSKIEAGHLELEHVDFEVESVLDRVRTLLAPRAADAGVGLLFDVDPDTPSRLRGDPLRLGQVLTNFTSNAVKFTPAGGEVVLRVAVVERDADRVELHLSVRDSGVGLSEEQLGRLFKPFTQADTSTTRAFGGTGLGLTICKDLVDLMGGSIWAESTPGVGSTFHCRIGFEVSSEATVLGCLPSRDLPDLRVLVVDDHRTAREIFGSMLTGFGLRVEEAPSGTRALELVAAAADSGDPFDLVLIDWHMPGLDGVETLRRMQAAGGDAGSPATILVTAFDADEAQRAARGVEVRAFIEKPATRSTLFDVLMGLVSRGGDGQVLVPTDPGDRIASPDQLAGAHVLVVEDNPVNQQLAVELLTMYGMRPSVVSNGQEALDLLTSGAHVDGVLMDCQMPVMDGYEATRRIRATPALEGLPIIAMTANAMREDVARVEDAGMDAHVAKPVDVQELLTTLAAWVVPSQPDVGAASVTSSSPSATTASTPDLPEVLGVDTAAGLRVTAGNVALYVDLVDTFRETNADFEAAFTAALRSEDPVAATRVAHSLAGTASTIGAMTVAAAARSLESACERHDDVAIEFWSRQVQTCLARLLPALGEILEWGRHETTASEGAEGMQAGTPAVDTLELLGEIEEHLAASDPSVIDAVRSLRRALAERPECDEPVRALTEAVRSYDFEAAAPAVATVRSLLSAGA